MVKITPNDETKELIEKAHNLIDYLNGKYGNEKELCLVCHSKTIDASGITHHPQCIILQLRQFLSNYRKSSPELEKKIEEAIAGCPYPKADNAPCPRNYRDKSCLQCKLKYILSLLSKQDIKLTAISDEVLEKIELTKDDMLEIEESAKTGLIQDDPNDLIEYQIRVADLFDLRKRKKSAQAQLAHNLKEINRK